MKKLLVAWTLILAFSCLLTSCVKLSSEYIFSYKYPTDEGDYIQTKRTDGILYVLENPISEKWEHGTIEIKTCYYNGESLNFGGTVTTDDRASFQQLETDSGSSVYFKINGIDAKLSSWGYTPLREDEKANTGEYSFFMGSFTTYNAEKEFSVSFANIEIPMKLNKVTGTPLESTTGIQLPFQTTTAQP